MRAYFATKRNNVPVYSFYEPPAILIVKDKSNKFYLSLKIREDRDVRKMGVIYIGEK